MWRVPLTTLTDMWYTPVIGAPTFGIRPSGKNFPDPEIGGAVPRGGGAGPLVAMASAPFFSYLAAYKIGTALAYHWGVKEDAKNGFLEFAAGVPRFPTSLLATSSGDDRYSSQVKGAEMNDKVFQYRVLFPHWNSQALGFLRGMPGFSVMDLTEGYLEAKFFATKAEARYVEAQIGHPVSLVAVSWWARSCPVCDTDLRALEEGCGDEGDGRER